MLFAHRGGPLEEPESTIRAFRYSWETVGVDVFELDVQVTRDDRLVVWHGPDLDNVRIEGVPDDPVKRPPGRRLVTDFAWDELADRAWVADPVGAAAAANLATVPAEPERRLVLLETLLEGFPDTPMNVEMKESFREPHIHAFLDTIDAHRGDRPIVVTSAVEELLTRFRALTSGRSPSGRYPTSVSLRGNVRILAATWLPFVRMPDMREQSFQTTWAGWVSSARAVRKVREAGGATYVFLTEFSPIPGLDEDPATLSDERVFRILDRGVDGIMTDRPGAVKPIIERWTANAARSL